MSITKRELIRRCHDLADYAVKKGKLKSPLICQNCNKSVRLEKHHPSYNFPLVVKWWCTKCHRTYHNKNRKKLYRQ
ncbi:MAG: hypothetical protein FVQ84_22670 [Planctomycetes bacterium]|nr:hypothetical protein [Planctomycetota bacterium]